ncbi:MAG TPA: hypothetical protein DCS45_11475, partial [Roseovarius nubinhibens]|nr:hypothetical protein [Roseovarius nubinhibens]
WYSGRNSGGRDALRHPAQSPGREAETSRRPCIVGKTRGETWHRCRRRGRWPRPRSSTRDILWKKQ